MATAAPGAAAMATTRAAGADFSGQHHRRSRRALTVVGMAAAGVPVLAHGAERHYVGPNNGGWNTVANWSATQGGAGGAGVPVAGDDAYLDKSISTNVNFNGSYAAALNSLSISGSSGATMTLTQSISTMKAATLLLGSSSGSNGTYSLSGSGTLSVSGMEYVGSSGTGLFSQSGGTHTIASALSLGHLTGSSGTYNLSGGSLTVNGEYVGLSGTGVFNQDGGTQSVTSHLYVAHQSGSSGTYSLSGSASLSVSWDEYLGYSGAAVFDHSGGTNSSGYDLYLGTANGSSGTYRLSGTGVLNISGSEYIGHAGAGSFIQSGGTNSAVNLYVGRIAGAGKYSLSGGSLSVSGNEYIGYAQGPSVFEQSGGTNTVATDLQVGCTLGATGSYNLSGGNLSVGAHEYVGYDATGSFNQSGGTHSVVQSLHLGRNAGSSGTYSLSGSGILSVSGTEYVGYSQGTGVFDQSGGTHSVGTDFYLGHGSSSGTYRLRGSSSLSVGGNAYVGGSGIAAGGPGTLNINSGTMTVTGALKVWDAAGTAVNLTGGALAVGSLDTSGNPARFNWTGGALSLTNGNLTIGGAGPLGTFLTLDVLKGLNVSGTTTIEPSSVLNLSGGVFSSAGLINNGTFNWTSGTVAITGAGGLTVGTGGALGDTVHLVYGQTLSVTGVTTVAGTGTLAADDGRLNAVGGITNNGDIHLSGAAPRITGGAFANNKLLRGNGRIDNDLTNFSGGEIRIESGKTLLFAGVNGTSTGKIDLQGGTVEFERALTNGAGGLITGRGFFYADAGLTNSGQIQLSAGLTDFHGTLSGNSGSKIIITGGGTATFYDDVQMNSGSECRVSTGSTVVFFGNVTGTDNFTGSGTKIFEGGTSALGAIVTGGSTIVEAPALLSVGSIREDALTINGGAVRVVQNGTNAGTSKLTSLTVGNAGQLDLSDNKLITRTPPGAANSGVYSGLQGLVQSGHNGGAWNGPGIVTSMSDAAAGLTSLGVATAEQAGYAGKTFGGVSIAAGDVLVMYTYAGDANLDGLVSGDDYTAIDFNILLPGTDGWANGDFNYDGIVSGDDYTVIDFNILAQGAPFPTAAASGATELSAVTAVPEPAAACALASVLAAGALRRRRRRVGKSA